MKTTFGQVALVLLFALFAGAVECRADDDLQALLTWQAGTTVSASAVNQYGEDRCFTAIAIPDGVWQRMQGKTYQPNPTVKRSDLRYLKVLHWDHDNRIHLGEMVCNATIAQVLVDIFRELYKIKYPIERMLLPDVYDADDERQMRDNNTSCFCYRVVAGSKVLSKHALGLAVDLNPLYNPYVKVRKDGTVFVQPSTGKPFADRKKYNRYLIDRNDPAYRLFIKKGFKWGGDWKNVKDYQHFEY